MGQALWTSSWPPGTASCPRTHGPDLANCSGFSRSNDHQFDPVIRADSSLRMTWKSMAESLSPRKQPHASLPLFLRESPEKKQNAPSHLVGGGGKGQVGAGRHLTRSCSVQTVTNQESIPPSRKHRGVKGKMRWLPPPWHRHPHNFVILGQLP